MKNKPQWLIDAENEINRFAETKFGKLSQTKIDQINGGALSPNRYDSEYQSEMGKLGGTKGGLATEENQRELHGDEYNKVMKIRLYDSIKNKKEFHSKGALASKASKVLKRDNVVLPILDVLPRNVKMTSHEVRAICTEHSDDKWIFNKIRLYYKHILIGTGSGSSSRFIIHEPIETKE